MNKNKNKKKGFTLIELLAVIVILGLLIAIAIPSITKYITESRKKTLTSTIGNYVGAVLNEVNNMEYTFTGYNTVYAVPIDCISLERGGTNPFGEWLNPNGKYFAYVLVQYDDGNESYTYGFTFKDSAGYGMYPTALNKLDTKGSQIKTDLLINQPTTGRVTSIATIDKWEDSGFKVDETTKLLVLEAKEEGDNITTCTRVQTSGVIIDSGDDDVIVDDNDNNEVVVENVEDYTLMQAQWDGVNAFWGYRSQIKTITFENSINIPNDISEGHKWDVSTNGSGKVMAYITSNASDSAFYDLYIQGDGAIYANSNSAHLFYQFANVESIKNLNILNTKNVTNMYSMFLGTGQYASTFSIGGMENWNTSNVVNMGGMFYWAGQNATTFDVGNLDNWDTTNVLNMDSMFREAGQVAAIFNIGNLSKWVTLNVTDMSFMFSYAGQNATTFDIGDLSNWNTANVTSMRGMFSDAGQNASYLLNLSNWHVDNVINYEMFNLGVTDKVIEPIWKN